MTSENDELVVDSFIDRFNVSMEEASDIFEETKKWLWLSAQAEKKRHGGLFIDKPLLVIDEMWHVFLLHSRLYYNFCFKYFDTYIHHTPASKKEKHKGQLDFVNHPLKSAEEYEAQLKAQYELIYDELGPETLIKWYHTLARRYTPAYIKSIRRN